MASIQKRGDVWSLRFDTYPNGKRKQVERSGFKTKKAAEKKLVEMLNEYNLTGSFIENKKITLDEVFSEFTNEEAVYTRAYSTIVRYKSVFKNQIQKDMGHLYISNITTKTLEKLIADKMQLGYSREYVKGIYKLLVVLFGFIIKREYLKINPVQKMTAPPDPRHIKEVEVYNKEELNLIKERLENTNVLIPFLNIINTGLRSSECFGLRWGDIHFEEGYLKVDRQLLYQDKRWCLAPCKTKYAYRIIYLSDSYLEYLKELKVRQEENRKSYGNGYKRNFVTDITGAKDKYIEVEDFINVKQNGEMLTSNSTKFMSKLAKEVIAKEFKTHNLRHTFATFLANEGINPKLLQRTLGHSKIEFTLKCYTHAEKESIEKMKNILKEKMIT